MNTSFMLVSCEQDFHDQLAMGSQPLAPPTTTGILDSGRQGIVYSQRKIHFHDRFAMVSQPLAPPPTTTGILDSGRQGIMYS